jgi:CubicO group peptidase (beta-lactamase class C family)
VRDLLTFRMGSGLILAPPNAYPIQKAISEQGLAIPSWPATMPHGPDEWIRRLGTLPLIHQPGEGWMYHAGSDVLGVLIARASGQPFEAFLRERIFAPLGMKDTAFSVPPEKRQRLASCYWFDHAHASSSSSMVPMANGAGHPRSRPAAAGSSRPPTTSPPLPR